MDLNIDDNKKEIEYKEKELEVLGVLKDSLLNQRDSIKLLESKSANANFIIKVLGIIIVTIVSSILLCSFGIIYYLNNNDFSITTTTEQQVDNNGAIINGGNDNIGSQTNNN